MCVVFISCFLAGPVVACSAGWPDAYCWETFCPQAVDIIPGRYAVCFLKQPDGEKYSKIAASGISYCIDDELVSTALNCTHKLQRASRATFLIPCCLPSAAV